MPDISPLITSRADNISLFAPATTPDFPVGVANSLSWSPTGLNSTYLATINVPSVTANTLVQATIAVNPSGGDFTDAVNCWLVSCYCGAGAINFIVAANPASPTRFPIVWSVVQP